MTRSLLINIAKFALAGGLIYYLIAQGTLDFSHFGIMLDRPDLLLTFAAVWFVCPVVLGSLRWWTLLSGLQVKITLRNAAQLQMIGFFFNVAMPGLVGGDLVKALYVMKQNGGEQRAEVMVSVVVDRVCGLASMFLLAALILLINLMTVLQYKEAQVLILFVMGCMAGTVIFFVAVFLPYSDEKDPIHRILRLAIPGFSILLRLYESLRMFRHQPMAIAKAVFYGCLVQLAIMGLYYYIFQLMQPPQVVDFAGVALAYPLGALVSSIPISPGGLGVGHVAYDRLFDIVGIQGGANAFNIFIISHMVFNLLGIIPFLMYRAQGRGMTADEIGKASEEATQNA